MKPSHIAIIGAPLDLGPGRRGVDMGPSAMRVANLNARLARWATRSGPGQRAGRSAREHRRRATRAPATWPRSRARARRLAGVVGESRGRRQPCRWCWAAITRWPSARSRAWRGISRRQQGPTGPGLDRRPRRHEHARASSQRQRARDAAGLRHRTGAGASSPACTAIAPKVDPRNVALVGIRDVDQLEKPHVQELRACAPSPCGTSTSAACAR